MRAIVLFAVFGACLCGCSATASLHPVAGRPAAVGVAPVAARAPDKEAAPSTSTVAVQVTEAPPLVPWNGPVEHLFFHTLVIDARLAFTRDSVGRAFEDYFLTEDEFRSILTQLDTNGWT